MGFYFSKFHETLHPHIPSVKNGSNEFIYNQLFAWTFPNDGDEHSFSGPQISRWIRNKEEIPSRIRQQAMISMEDALDNYAGCFYDIFCLGKLTISGQALEMMHDAMDQFQKEFPIAVCPHVDEKKDKRIFPASIALVTALIYDDLAYDGVSNANRHIETGLYMALLDAMEVEW